MKARQDEFRDQLVKLAEPALVLLISRQDALKGEMASLPGKKDRTQEQAKRFKQLSQDINKLEVRISDLKDLLKSTQSSDPKSKPGAQLERRLAFRSLSLQQKREGLLSRRSQLQAGETSGSSAAEIASLTNEIEAIDAELGIVARVVKDLKLGTPASIADDIKNEKPIDLTVEEYESHYNLNIQRVGSEIKRLQAKIDQAVLPLKQDKNLWIRDQGYLNKISSAEGMRTLLGKISAGLNADTAGRVLPRGLLPSWKYYAYSGVVVMTQTLLMAGFFVAFQVNPWLIPLLFIIGYKVYWPIANKIALTLFDGVIFNYFITPQGHSLLSMPELKEYVDRYAKNNGGSPFVFPIQIPKFSGDEEEFGDWIKYVEKDLAGLKPATDYLGDNFKVVFVCTSASFGKVGKYENEQIEVLNEKYRERFKGRVTFARVEVGGGKWAFKKPGDMVKFSAFLNTGATRAIDLYTDKTQ